MLMIHVVVVYSKLNYPKLIQEIDPCSNGDTSYARAYRGGWHAGQIVLWHPTHCPMLWMPI